MLTFKFWFLATDFSMSWSHTDLLVWFVLVCSVRQQLWRFRQGADIIRNRENGSEACLNRENAVAVNFDLTCIRGIYTDEIL